MNDTPTPSDMIWRTELPNGLTRIDLGSPIPAVHGEPQPVCVTDLQNELETGTERTEPENAPVPADAAPADPVPADAETASLPTRADAMPEIGKPSPDLTEWKPGLGRD